MIKKFERLPMPTGTSMSQITFIDVVDVGGHPYLVYKEQVPDQRNNWVYSLHLVPFVEEKKS